MTFFTLLIQQKFKKKEELLALDVQKDKLTSNVKQRFRYI